jgi:hypothetical protein
MALPWIVQGITAMNVFRSGFWNLAMACLWLGVGIMFLISDREGSHNSSTRVSLGETSVSLGWPALFIAGYNLLRFWQRRSAWVRSKVDEEEERKRQMKHAKDRARERNPEFIFEDEPTKTEPPA